MQAEIEQRQPITTLECRLMEALSTIYTMKAKRDAPKEHVDDSVAEATKNVIVMSEAKIEVPRHQ